MAPFDDLSVFQFGLEDAKRVQKARVALYRVIKREYKHIIEEVVAGNSKLAIKLYEDLLVGYKNNKKAAVYHSQLFTKYIIS